MKRLCALILCALLAANLTACSDTADSSSEGQGSEEGQEMAEVQLGSYRYYRNVEELVEVADLIIRCTALEGGQREERLDVGDGTRIPYTVTAVRVDEVFQGDVQAGDEMEIKQTGDSSTETEWIVYLEEGGEYVLFLETYEDSPASVLNPVQGMYPMEDGQLVILDGNDLVLTLEDLS